MLLFKWLLLQALQCFITGEIVLFAGVIISMLSRLFKIVWEMLELNEARPTISRSCAAVSQLWNMVKPWLFLILPLVFTGQPARRSQPSISHASQRLIFSGMRDDFQPLRDVPPFQPLTYSVDIHEYWATQHWMFGESVCETITALRDYHVDVWISETRQAGEEQMNATVGINNKIGRIAQQLDGQVAGCGFAHNKTGPASRVAAHDIECFERIFQAEAAERKGVRDGTVLDGQVQIQGRLTNAIEAFAKTLTDSSIDNVQQRLANMAAGIARLQERHDAVVDPCSADKVQRIEADWVAATTEGRPTKKRLRQLGKAKLTWQCSSGV